MAKLTDEQIARRDLTDTIRTIVGLESRIERRHRLNDLESRILAEFDERIALGQQYKPDIKALIQGELG